MLYLNPGRHLGAGSTSLKTGLKPVLCFSLFCTFFCCDKKYAKNSQKDDFHHQTTCKAPISVQDTQHTGMKELLAKKQLRNEQHLLAKADKGQSWDSPCSLITSFSSSRLRKVSSLKLKKHSLKMINLPPVCKNSKKIWPAFKIVMRLVQK